MHQEVHRSPQRISAVRAHHGRGRDASVVERWSPVVRNVMTVAAVVVVVAALWATAVSR
ncbi:hypothetical protein [Streptomyces sp. NPDC001604]|uniref:hypothetical protein n=1 Tax=Streptomyces sp. NPDC001604 TaxID=3364593 RepID=UPI003696D0CF